ncbi:MAG TPA: hypothetical protein VGD16_02905 [Enterovirga sp.]
MSLGRTRQSGLALAAGFAVSAILGCSELDRLADYAFPPSIPGLPESGSWVSLPVSRWVTEGGVTARAIVACFAPSCAARVAVGLFRAEGTDAALLAAILADPERLKRGLEEKDRQDPSPKRRLIKTEIAVERLRESPLAGFAVRLARPDGSHAVQAVVLATGARGPASVLIVVGENAEAVRRVALSVAAHLA